jgi:large subunit ribosomal protein L25
MGKALPLKVEIRENVGSKSSAEIRTKGCIPAIVYGHKQQPVAVSLNAHNFVEALHHGHRLMDIQVGQKTEKMIVKELQHDHLGRNIIHVDLMRVDVTETIKVAVPVELKGIAKGTHEGGIIEEHTDQLEIECRASDIPESIAVSVKDINVGDSLHAGDIELPAGIRLVSEPSLVIVTCSLVAAAKTTEELEAEVPAAPEIIGEDKEETEQSQSE